MAVSTRNDQLDGLRGYAALAVVFWHAMLIVDAKNAPVLLGLKFSQVPYQDLAQKIILTLLAGDTAVTIFFVLSGAVLMQSLQRETGPMAGIAARFAVRRVLRIYPMLLVAIAVTALARAAIGQTPSGAAIFQNVVLYDATVNGATWTLNVEMIAVIVLLLAFAAYRRFKEVGLVISLLVMLALIHSPPAKPYLVYFKPTFFCFAFGMMIPTRIGNWVYQRLPSLSWPLLLVVMLFVRHIFIGVNRVPSLTQELCAALLVLLLYHSNAGALGRFLARPSAVFLGSISYSLYLLNVPLLVFAGWQTLADRPVVYGLLVGVGIAALTIPIAYLALIWVEKPGIALGRWLTQRADVRSARKGALSEPG